ncbi:MAG: hypothetical protein JKP98_20785 [Rhodobacteraceae bacterium]|nr:hypothetical protein [Paracoccaceae bacterium]
MRTGLARFGKLEALIGFAVGDVEPDLAAAMRREATALNRLQGLVVMLQATGPPRRRWPICGAFAPHRAAP